MDWLKKKKAKKKENAGLQRGVTAQLHYVTLFTPRLWDGSALQHTQIHTNNPPHLYKNTQKAYFV